MNANDELQMMTPRTRAAFIVSMDLRPLTTEELRVALVSNQQDAHSGRLPPAEAQRVAVRINAEIKARIAQRQELLRRCKACEREQRERTTFDNEEDASFAAGEAQQELSQYRHPHTCEERGDGKGPLTPTR